MNSNKIPLCTMYPQCVGCPKLDSDDPNDSCDGPNFLAMTPAQLLEWIRARKDHLKLTNARVAELSDMSIGTINGVFAGTHQDFKFGTISAIVRALVGGSFRGRPCPDPGNTLGDQLNAELTQLKEENALLRSENEKMRTLADQQKDKLLYLSGEIQLLRDHNTKATEHNAANQHIWHEQLKSRNATVVVLGALLAVSTMIVIVFAAMLF